MALTFDEAYGIIKRIGPEIGQLAQRGDKMARDVFERYRDWYHHEFKAYKSGIAMPDSRRRRAVVSALEQYLQRDLTISERTELAGKKGHLVEKAPDQPTNIIQMSVRRALHSRR